MEEQAVRSLGGRLALWVFWIFCLYFSWRLLHVAWAASQLEPGTERWFSALSAVLLLAVVGVILGAIAWYTRPVNPDA